MIQRVSDREIAKRFTGLVRSSIARHKKNHLANLSPDDSAAETRALTVVSQISLAPPMPPSANDKGLQHQKNVVMEMWKLYSVARKKGNLAVATQNLRNLNEAIKSLGTFTGELATPAGVAIGINVNSRAVWEDCDPAVMRWALARHIQAMVSFEPQALAELQLLSSLPCPVCNRWKCQHDLL
jgi:hypothetical protein